VLLEFGRRRGYLSANPAADIKIRRRPEGEVSILAPDDQVAHATPETKRPTRDLRSSRYPPLQQQLFETHRSSF